MRKLLLALITVLTVQCSFAQSRLSQTLKSLPGQGLTHQYHHVTSIKQNVTSSFTIPLAVGNYTILAGGEYPSLLEFRSSIHLKNTRITEVTETSGKLIRINIRVNLAADHTFSVYNQKSSDTGGEEYMFIIVAKDNNSTTTTTSSAGSSLTFMNDREQMNIKGVAQSITENSYKTSSTFAVSNYESLMSCEYQFDIGGYMTKISEEFTDCEPCTYTYGRNKMKSTSYDGKTKLKLRYTKKGSLWVEEQFDLDGADEDDDFEDLDLYGIKSYVLDEKGRIKEETEYLDEKMKEPLTRTRKEFDSQGRLTAQYEEYYNDESGKWKLMKKAEYSNFDEAGNPRSETRLGEDMKPNTKMSFVYIYDRLKNWTERRMTVEFKDEKSGQWTTEHYVTRRVVKY